MDARNLTDWAKDLKARTTTHDRIRALEGALLEAQDECDRCRRLLGEDVESAYMRGIRAGMELERNRFGRLLNGG